MTVYWILPLFWDDGKLEFDCTYLMFKESIQQGMSQKIVIEAKKCQVAVFGHVGCLVQTCGVAQSGKF